MGAVARLAQRYLGFSKPGEISGARSEQNPVEDGVGGRLGGCEVARP